MKIIRRHKKAAGQFFRDLQFIKFYYYLKASEFYNAFPEV